MLCLLTHFIVGISTRILTVNMIKKFCARPFLIGWKSIFCSSSFAIKPTIVPSCIIKRELKRFVDVHLTLETFFNTKIFQKLLQIGLKCVLNRSEFDLKWTTNQHFMRLNINNQKIFCKNQDVCKQHFFANINSFSCQENKLNFALLEAGTVGSLLQRYFCS